MNVSVKSSMVIRPVSSKRGSRLLLFFLLIGLFFAALSLFIKKIAPSSDAKAHTLIVVMVIISVITITMGIIFYFIFPRVRIIFDSSSEEVKIQSGFNSGIVIPFNRLEPFQVYHVLRGYAHQYYCRNLSFGEFSDLFFSAYHERTLKKGKEMAAITGVKLYDFDGNQIV